MLEVKITSSIGTVNIAVCTPTHVLSKYNKQMTRRKNESSQYNRTIFVGSDHVDTNGDNTITTIYFGTITALHFKLKYSNNSYLKRLLQVESILGSYPTLDLVPLY